VIIQLNPVKWFQRKATVVEMAAVVAAAPAEISEVSNTAKAEESITMASEFVSILDKIEQDALKVGEVVLADAVKYLPFATTLAGFIFPAAVVPLQGANAVVDLLQNAVADAEQKLAAAGLKGDVGPQKLANVLTIVTGAVTGLLAEPTISAALAKAGITVNTGYITNLVNAVVSFLNVQGVVEAQAA
jgi:hypothetical protein